MSTKLSIGFAFLLLIVSGQALANDSTARVGVGSIVLLKNEQIRMLQETLEISPSIVRVKYEFLNESANDIRTAVAFPMPAYGWTSGEHAVEGNVGPLKSFKLLVDGVTVPTQLSRRALIGNRDVTDKLRKIGLTDKQIFLTFGDCKLDDDVGIKCGISKKQESEIAHLVGKRDVRAEWKVEETVYWDQVFPAGRTIEIRHEYPPFVGMSYTAPYQSGSYYGGLPTGAWRDAPVAPNEACLDDGARLALTKKIKSRVEDGAKMVYVTLNDVEYILGTGRNWKGPIKDFKLRIEKSSPDQIVSLCFPGKPKRINTSVLEFSQSNYAPHDRLVIHFYTVK